jgi:DNA-binding NtrC family response regulator
MKIVIIDDEVEIGEILSYLIKKEGFQPVAFNHPEEALVSIPSLNPQFIVCDFKMPGLNGLELFLKIKDQINCPFMILTGEPSTDPEELKALGIIDVLFKPRDLKRVTQLIKDHFIKK